MLALRVVKTEDHNHGKKAKRVKGQWTVKIEREQEAKDDMYYVWLWEGSQIKRQLYAALALVLIFAVVLYPLWPLVLRKGVYHLSWGLMGLLVAFFGMAIFRVILFCITYFILSPGFWLFPNLWEDVGFFDSFKPVWAWHEVSVPQLSCHMVQANLYRLPNPRRRSPRPWLEHHRELLPDSRLQRASLHLQRPLQPEPTLRSALAKALCRVRSRQAMLRLRLRSLETTTSD
jgi:translocation protein SEC62